MHFNYLGNIRSVRAAFRRTFVIFAVLCSGLLTSHAQTWKRVGAADFTPYGTQYMKMAINKAGTPYVVFTDTGTGQKASVMKFDGIGWIAVGSPAFTTGKAIYTSIAFDTADVPYVVFSDGDNGFRATVMKYDGTGWATVGSGPVSPGVSDFTSITFDKDNSPYIVYNDIGSGRMGPITVMKFDGTNWNAVGPVVYSGGGSGITMIIDKKGTPYVAYHYYGNAFVKKYDGAAWVDMASAELSTVVSYPSIAVDDTGLLYIAYEDDVSTRYGMSVMKFDGLHWTGVGRRGFSVGEIYFPTIAVDHYGTPIVFYTDGGAANDAIVKQYNGSDWVPLGDTAFAKGVVNYNNMSIDNSGNVYVEFVENVASYQGNVYSIKNPHDPDHLQVNKTGDKNAVIFKVFPNPCDGQFEVTLSAPEEKEYAIIITDVLGKTIKQFNSTTNKQQTIYMDVPGLYFVTAVSSYDTKTTMIYVK